MRKVKAPPFCIFESVIHLKICASIGDHSGIVAFLYKTLKSFFLHDGGVSGGAYPLR